MYIILGLYIIYVNETNIRDELNVIEDIKNINEITFLQDEKKSVILHLANLELINNLSFLESINYSNIISTSIMSIHSFS